HRNQRRTEVPASGAAARQPRHDRHPQIRRGFPQEPRGRAGPLDRPLQGPPHPARIGHNMNQNPPSSPVSAEDILPPADAPFGGYPNSSTYLPKTAASLAEVLKLNGYSTFAVGKWHLTPSGQTSSAGPFDRWPLGLGFEHFYGFHGGATDHWHPTLHRDNSRIRTPRREGYHLSADLADQSIAMLRNQQQSASGKPFFLYLAFGA